MPIAETNAASAKQGTASLVGRLIYGIILGAAGGILAINGAKLIQLHGSPYYLGAGLAAIGSGVAVIARRWRLGSAIYLALMVVSLVWSLCEAGLNGWALAPRVLSPFVLGLPFLAVGLIRGAKRDRLAGWLVVAAAVVLVLAVSTGSRYAPAPAIERSNGMGVAASDDWPHFGNTVGGTRFSPLDQINRSNVRQLKAVWSTQSGPFRGPPLMNNESVPLKVGDHLYSCSPLSDVLDLDPDTGKIRWRFDAKTKTTGVFHAMCRGVAYYAIPGATGVCATRAYTATIDARLIALDAQTGQPCPGFGVNGQVDLMRGQKQRSPGYYYVSSAPAVIRGKLVMGGLVADGQHVGEPSGVIRAYDAVNGKLAWAWDMGNPTNHGEPAPGQTYTLGTPNSWGPLSADEALGLVYIPTGNSTPDYWGGHRSAASNKYNSSLVAIDAETGEPRWSFQTAHYDLWDYDIASQPVLFDLKTAGGVVPAVLQPTKRGQIFILDRRTGVPLFPVVEKPAPQKGAVEKVSATQPWSVALPDLKGPDLKESSMWGLTAIDQLWCRIKFRQARYEGSMTPPGVTYSIADPGYIGGSDWGSASVDTNRQLAFFLSNRIVNYIRLVPRSDPKARAAKADPASNQGAFAAQEGTPFAADIHAFLSPLQIPCQAPPSGLINALDLKTGKMVWSRSIGSARDLGPMKHASYLPFALGTSTRGGPMSTTGGLVFAGGTKDHAFRAFDSETGKLLFEADLPGSSDSSPVSYRSHGRQFLVISSEAPSRGGATYAAITAFALPTK